MFEAAELGRKVTKAEFRAQAPALREELLELQQRLRQARFPVIVVLAGVDAAGKGETVNLLHEWMDPRFLVTRAYGEPSDEERERPEYWRYWRDLPPHGRVGLFLSSWYSAPILDRVYRRVGAAAFERRLTRIVQFERALTEDGAVLLKFWLHLGRRAQRKRLRKLEKDPLTRWRVSAREWKNWRRYEHFVAAAETAIRRTSLGRAPWHIVEGADERYRTLAVTGTLRDALRRALGAAASPPRLAPAAPAARTPPPAERGARQPTILSHLDMRQTVSPRRFATALEKLQGRLNRLQRQAQARGVSTVLVFEGWDAAGKGGAVRRVTAALDARSYQVVPIAAPNDEERARHYLWRFWRHLSRAGRVTIFDRSWYGRVLVERVEGLASEAEWGRAYGEINQFEEQLVEHGIVLVKFWVHVTKDEQLRRFRERRKTRHKRWKLTADDWRNRRRWALYEQAVNDMVERTSTRRAPWTLVEGNDKNFARLKVLETVCARLQETVGKA